LYAAILCSVLQGATHKAPEAKLVAQGEYSAIQDGAGSGSGSSPQPANTGRSGDPAELPLDHWFLYQMPDGTFKVDTEIKTVEAPGHAEEHSTFSKEMKRRTYEWKYERKTKEEAQGKSKAAGFHCDFADGEARCAGTTISGRTFSTSLAMQVPYSFMPITDEALFDFPWSFQAMIWQAERSSSRPSSIAMVTFGDAAAENGTVLKSLPGKFGLVRYLGRDTIEVAKQKVNAHKFEAKSAEHEDGALDFWLSDSGLLLKMKGAGKDSPGIFVLSRYEGPAL
jgi:hypothetical protein